MMAQLKFLNGEREGVVYTLREGRTVIGRQVGDITLADKEVSSIHAILSYERDAWYVMDLGSTNGVWVNEQLKSEAELADGAELRVGQTRMLFRLDETADAPPPQLSEAPPPGAGPAPVVGLDPDFPGASDQTMELAGASEQPSGGQPAVPPMEPESATPEPLPPPPEPVQELDAAAAQPFDDGPGDDVDFPGGPAVGAAEERGLSPFEIVLEVVEGADRGLIYRFNSETILLGRLNTDLVVRDSDVSRRHAIIEVFEDDLVYIRDLGSTNGTFVNGQRISTVKLAPNDQIRLGRCTLGYDYRKLS